MQSSGARGGLISLIQNNVLGSAEFHKQQSWPFDPAVSARRAPEFIALHGDKSEKLIERIGLGLDGRQMERRQQQLTRDYLYDRQQQQVGQKNVAGTGAYQLQQQQSYDPSPRLEFPAGFTARWPELWTHIKGFSPRARKPEATADRALSVRKPLNTALAYYNIVIYCRASPSRSDNNRAITFVLINTIVFFFFLCINCRRSWYDTYNVNFVFFFLPKIKTI